MSISQLKAQGTVFAYSVAATSPLSFTTIPEVMDASESGRSNPMIDSTDMSETSKSYKSAGVTEEGDFSMTIGWLPANAVHTAIDAAITAGTEWVLKVTYTDSPQTTKQATVVPYQKSESYPKEGLLAADVTFKVVSAWA